MFEPKSLADRYRSYLKSMLPHEKSVLDEIHKLDPELRSRIEQECNSQDINERVKLYEKAEAVKEKEKERVRLNPNPNPNVYQQCPNGCDDHNDRCTYFEGGDCS